LVLVITIILEKLLNAGQDTLQLFTVRNTSRKIQSNYLTDRLSPF